jgi:uncharacterized protein YacL
VAGRDERTVLVELVRLVLVCAFAVGGWHLARTVDPGGSDTLVVGIIVGTGTGYVLGGFLGRGTVAAVSGLERELGRVSAPELLAGTIGLVLGLVVAALLSVLLLRVPAAGLPLMALAFITLGFAGYRLARARYEELFAVFGVKPRAAGARRGEVSVVDSSALMDARLRALVRLGVVGGTLIVPAGVVDELRAIADSGDPGRRSRGRQALDLLGELRRDPLVELVLVEGAGPVSGTEDVDARLVRLARERGGALITNDAALAKVAAALDVPVLSIHALADALRLQVLPGDRVRLRVVREGREAGQGVGYLEDGTMVVVEGAAHVVGQEVEVAVTNAVQTQAGRLVFARLDAEGSG